MLDYKTEALNRVGEYAITKLPEYQAIVEEFCKQSDVDVVTLINQILHRHVTINFHPDRLSNNNKSKIDSIFGKQGFINAELIGQAFLMNHMRIKR